MTWDARTELRAQISSASWDSGPPALSEESSPAVARTCASIVSELEITVRG